MKQTVPTHLTACPFCADAPTVHHGGEECHALGLTYGDGVCELAFRRVICPSCHGRFLGCWAFQPGDSDTAILASAPDAAEWFIFRSRLRRDNLAALHCRYLQFMTTSFLHLRASFSGLAKVAMEMCPGYVLTHHDCERALEHGWFLFHVLKHVYTDDLRGTPVRRWIFAVPIWTQLCRSTQVL